MLGIPLNIAEFRTKTLKNSKVIDVCTQCGTYGMGGSGFFGLKVKGGDSR